MAVQFSTRTLPKAGIAGANGTLFDVVVTITGMEDIAATALPSTMKQDPGLTCSIADTTVQFDTTARRPDDEYAYRIIDSRFAFSTQDDSLLDTLVYTSHSVAFGLQEADSGTIIFVLTLQKV